ncbi:MAG: hypothetical protein ACR652_08785 [Methylocystis sp.]|uniref:hypothetical protein n=1 Tax=Methylocystis sp. TaxID=1911079 RepID=UPI003DA2E506
MDARAHSATPALTERVVFVTNDAEAPSLFLNFIQPLKSVSGLETAFVTENDLKADAQELGEWRVSPAAVERLTSRLADFDPTLIVFCRYSGPCAPEIVEWARAAGKATIYHIDDDLLQVPKDIGEEKARYHNQPRRLHTVRYLLDNATLAYCSTETLRQGLFGDAVSPRILAGDICSAADCLAPPTTDEAPSSATWALAATTSISRPP